VHETGQEILHLNKIKPLFHQKGELSSVNDRVARANRLDPLELRVNARFIENQFRVRVWNKNQYKWIFESFKLAGMLDDLPAKVNPFLVSPLVKRKLPRVLIVADVPGWALDRIAQKTKKLLSNIFEIQIVYTKDYSLLQTTINLSCWNAIIFLWRNPLFQMMREGLVSERSLARIGVLVYDHQGWMGYDEEVKRAQSCGIQFGVVNESLQSILAKNGIGAHYVPDGVDRSMFYPSKNISQGEKIVVGWAGNTQWGGVDDNKGFKSVISKLIPMANPNHFRFQILDASRGRIPQDVIAKSMRNWDVVMCTSQHEGTPNPVLEGIATGLHVVSTLVGMVPELNNRGSKIEVVGRSPELFMASLNRYRKNQQDFLENRRQNYLSSALWNWPDVIIHHKNFIFSVLKD
jgi:glycosyltransferase involved in cell wall biosynthesis